MSVHITQPCRVQVASTRRWAVVLLVAAMAQSVAHGVFAGGAPRRVAPRHAVAREVASPVVTTTADVVADDGETSLREAINYANDHPGTTISFNIPNSDSGFDGHVFTIQPAGPLPPLLSDGSHHADGTVIDGVSQVAFTGDTNSGGPVVALDGSQAGDLAIGLELEASNCTVQGLVISNFDGIGIHVAGANAGGNLVQGCYIGTDAAGESAAANGIGINLDQGAHESVIGLGEAPAAGSTVTPQQMRNIISGNRTQGVFLTGDGTDNNVIAGNYIGTDAGGAQALANHGNGVCISMNVQDAAGPQHNILGGTYDGGRNVISGNVVAGIQLSGPETSGNQVLGNYIGTDADGRTRINNLYGLRLVAGCHDNTIGGAAAPDLTAPAAGNVISGNDLGGILIYGPSTSSNRVQGNFIGTDCTGQGQLGNSMNGVKVYLGAHNNVIGGAQGDPSPAASGNTIAYNGSDGVQVADNSVGNAIRGNSIFANAGLGINLVGAHESAFGVTLNDTRDVDTGGNNLQNFPVLNATNNPTVLTGRFYSTPNQTFMLDFYGNQDASPSGYGQGRQYLGSTSVTTDSNGRTTFTFTNPHPKLLSAGEVFSATATSASGDTSEFSAVPLSVIAMAPSGGPAGTRVVIRGTGLDDVQSIRFQNVAAQFSLQSPSQITVVVPPHAPLGNDALVVTTRSTGATVALNRVFAVTATPPNDNFDQAQLISDRNGTVAGVNIGATDQYSAGEPHHAATGGGHSIWYRWNAPGNGPAVFTTTGSDFKAVLGVYTGGSVGSLHRVAFSGNLSATAVTSRVIFNAVQGTPYLIAVDSDGDRQGNVQLNWSLTAALPSNASPADAWPISGLIADFHGLTNLPRQPIWFKWPVQRDNGVDHYDNIVPQGGSVTFDTAGSAFDSKLTVYSSSSPNASALTELAGPLAQNDDARPDGTSRVTINVRPNTTYYIALEGVNYSVGSVALSWTAGAASAGPVHWSGPVSGNWSDASKWSTGQVPDPTDAVAIDAPGDYQVTLDVDATVAGLTLGTGAASAGRQHLAMAGHTLTLVNLSSVARSGVLDVNGGTVVQNNTLTTLGTMNWNGGTLMGKGTTYINPGGVLNIGDSADATAGKVLAQQTISNSGRVNWTGATAITGDNGASVLNYGTFDVTQGSAFNAASTATTLLPSFYNYGTFIREAGAGSMTFGVPFNNRGTVNVQIGTLALHGGGLNYGRFTIQPGAAIDFSSDCFFDKQQTTFNGGGQVLVSSNAFTVDSPVSMQNLELSGGAVSGPGDLSVSGAAGSSALDWRGGAMTGTGSTSVGAGTALVIDGSADKALGGRTLNNRGTVHWIGSGRILAGDGAVINNSGDFSAPSGVIFAYSGTGKKLVFSNSGRFSPGAVPATTGALLGPAPNSVVDGQPPRLGSQDGPGISTMTGDFAQTTNGAFAVLIGDALSRQCSQLQVSGNATLGGTVSASLLPGVTPAVGTRYKIFSATSTQGSFATKSIPLGNGLRLDVATDATGVYLVVHTSDTTPPTVSFTAPLPGATLSSLASITGRAADNTGAGGIDHVDLTVQRRSDSKYWTASASGWTSTRTVLRPPLTAAGSGYTWAQSTAFTATTLLAGSYTLQAYAYDRSGLRSALAALSITVASPTRSGDGSASASLVALSSATASAAGSSVTLIFSGALDAESSGDAGHYTVTVNGQAVTVQSAAYNGGTRTVTLDLGPEALRAGDSVVVHWDQLLATGGGLASGDVALVAR